VADATVPRARHDEALAADAEITPAVADSADPAVPRALLLLWAALAAGLVAFLAFGTVRVGAGNWFPRRMPIREIWSRFLGFLADQGASPILILLVTASAAAALVGAGYVVWLAFALRDAPPEAQDGDPAEQ
jgi:hypothetical protein